ncbi:MAG: DHH family phosphoesterase, partial [Peptostreptococcaceae bacterium]
MAKFIIKDKEFSNDEKNEYKKLRQLSSLFNISDLSLQILFNRGYKNEKEILHLLNGELKDVHPAEFLTDCEKFTEIVKEAILSKKKIICYSDYDIDGVCSASALCLGVKNAGGIIDFYTNNRFEEGYGITKNGVDDLLAKFPDTNLIITTDNGIVGFEGINHAVKRGIDVIVTDHHEQGDEIPKDALAVINPKRKDCDYPFDGLCGAGVVFKLLISLYYEMNLDLEYIYDLLDIIALATVGDLVPLVDENRIIVKEGLKKISYGKRLAFKKLREGLGVTKVDEETFGYTYGPLINAIGRINGTPGNAIRLFITDDESEMDLIVKELVDLNNERKELTKSQEKLALSLLHEKKELPNVIVLKHKDFHEGVVGLIAG